MTRWQICHQSGRVLFTTDNEVTARNREQFGWKVIKVDKSREQFEQFIQRKFGDLIDQRVTKNGDGEYFSWDMQVAWLSWQASRAAIEIELPDITNKKYQSKHTEGGFRSEAFWLDTRKVIRDTGIKVNDIANGTCTE